MPPTPAWIGHAPFAFWLVEAFNPAKFPWFRDEFVHPSEFKAVYMGESLTHLFGGFSTEGR
jgi:hypothetical protein